MKALITLTLTALFLAACTTVAPQEKPDVARVISITDIQQECGIVPVTMTYEDSHGVRQEMHYQVWANGCSGD